MATNSGGSGSSPESGSGSGSGSSSGGSGETARPKAAQNPPESITFTFSSRNSPFAHLSPPGSVTFVSNKRRGSESSRDRPHRKQQSAQSSFGPGWIALSPLKPVTEVPPPLFETKSSSNTPPTPTPNSNTAVFSSRPIAKVRTSPRLSLVAQHYHATSPHPSFNTPPALVTPPPQDPFGQLKRLGPDGYFPLMPPSSRTGSKKKSSKSTSLSSRTKIEQPQPMHFSPQPGSSRTPTANRLESGTSESTPRILSRMGHESAGKRSVPIPVASSAASTPTQLKSRSRKSTPPHLKTTPQPPLPKSGSPQPQPSIDAFRDCFGVLTTRVENVFPTRSRYRGRSDSGGSENFNVMGSGPGLSESQCRWTRRWIRRTLRGVGSMGSGSTSSGSASTGASRRRGGTTIGGSSLANTMIYLGLGNGVEESRETGGSAGSSSQDSLDRVRISRSNAPSPSSSSGGSSIAAPTKSLNKGKAKDTEEFQNVAPNLVSTQPTVAVQS
ncbi:unnamed protein product [Rhizoctonia solani]|uniref:Uncharacterized protein n=1 Tax=Rhizoctonia solani TaxID=456999 RepID=A0A8H3D1R7_9AGAM|nr:unnamed protein product [Rhizoctonia solani]